MCRTNPIPLTIDMSRIDEHNPKPKMDPIHPLEVRPGEMIRFTAPESDLRVFFPNRYPPPLPFEIVEIEGSCGVLWATPEGALLAISRRSTITVRVKSVPERRRRYPYSVYTIEANAFAEGKSDPVIIILGIDSPEPN